jgi:TolA-binding protein
VDTSPIGKTPLSASIVPGVHDLTITLGNLPEVQERVTLSEGTIVNRTYDLRAGSEPSDRVEVVQAEQPSPQKRPVRKRLKRSQPSPIKDVVEVTAKELLGRAQNLRAERKWQDAADSYRGLIRTYPKSAEAQVALVSLGEILLDHLGDAVGAIDAFESYLKTPRRGPLYQEALYNRARALRVLGKKPKELETLKTFLRMYPEAIQARNARTRVEQLECELRGKCQDKNKKKP